MYIDGITTEFILDYITEKGAIYITNAIKHVCSLAKTGYTTPDREEAGIKHISFSNCKRGYIVADLSKFDSISPVKFSKFDNAVIITNKIVEGYGDCMNIIIAE